MTTIHTKYLTNANGRAEMKASAHIDGKTISIRVPYDYEAGSAVEVHWRAAHALLAQKIRTNYYLDGSWYGSFSKPGEYVFVLTKESSQHRVRPAMPNAYKA